MKIIYLLFTLMCYCAFGQEFLPYPKGQDFYKGGEIQFYKDVNRLLIEKGLKPCEDQTEYYHMQLLIYPDGIIKLGKSQYTLDGEKTKCSKDLIKKVLVDMEGWNPAIVGGNKVHSVKELPFIPIHFFENYREGYSPIVESAEFEGGIDKFRRRVIQNVDVSRFMADDNFKIVVSFVVDADGKITGVKADQETGNGEFDYMIITAISSVKKKWKPAKVNGSPVRSKFILPMIFNFKGL